MKKFTLAIVAFAAMVLASCGGSKPQQEVADQDTTKTFEQAQLEASVKMHLDSLSTQINEKQFAAIEENIKAGKIKLSADEKKVLNATWESLPDFGGEENAIAVVDTSGSMYCSSSPSPASVALSLGLYFAERNKGIFHNHFIEFSHDAKLIEIKGETFADRLRYLASFNEIADTNIEAVFDLILNAAINNNIPQEELPATLYLISDMEFNSCVRDAGVTNFENAKRKYETFGYKLPNVVFWNVQSRNRQQPVTMNEQGVALVSGCTPKLFSMVASGNIDPYSFMMEVVDSERYEKIVA